MSDAFEDRIRAHLADQASRVATNPDPDGLIQRSAGPRGRRSVLVGAVALAMVFAGAGVLTGVNLAGGSTVSSSSSVPSVPSSGPQRSGASIAPSGSASPNLPAIAGQLRYTLLLTRTTSAGVTVRVYAVANPSGGCQGPAACPPTGTFPGPVPCPQNATCVQPMIAPHTSPTTLPAESGGGGPAATGTVPSNPTPSDPTAGCGQLVIELSTDRAVATATTPWPTAAPTSSDTLDVLGEGSFGSAEGAPVGWVAVWAGAGVTSVHLSAGTSASDSTAPTSGLAVLALPDASGLAGANVANVTGTDQSGATVATVPADQVPGLSACAPPTPSPTTTTPTTTTTTTVPDPTSTTTPPDTSTTTVSPSTSAPVPPPGAP